MALPACPSWMAPPEPALHWHETVMLGACMHGSLLAREAAPWRRCPHAPWIAQLDQHEAVHAFNVDDGVRVALHDAVYVLRVVAAASAGRDEGVLAVVEEHGLCGSGSGKRKQQTTTHQPGKSPSRMFLLFPGHSCLQPCKLHIYDTRKYALSPADGPARLTFTAPAASASMPRIDGAHSRGR
jgi:hypothetical protein